MRSQVLINGTTRSITGGKALVSGTTRAITSGKALVEGAARDIAFDDVADPNAPTTYLVLGMLDKESSGTVSVDGRFSFYTVQGRKLLYHLPTTHGPTQWEEYTEGSTLTFKGEVWFAGEDFIEKHGYSQGYTKFTGTFETASGSLAAFRDWKSARDGVIISEDTVGSPNVNNLFKNVPTLTDVAELDLGGLDSETSFRGMFQNLTNLVSAPKKFPFNAVAYSQCYEMFSGCTSLVHAMDMSDVTQVDYGGCREMYYKCTSLATPPNLSNVNKLGLREFEPDVTEKDRGVLRESYAFYEMFRGCTALTSPIQPNLTTIYGRAFYGCYRDCTSLVSVMPLKIVHAHIGSFAQCYEGCTSLTLPMYMGNISYMEYFAFYSCYEGCTSMNGLPSIPKCTIKNHYVQYTDETLSYYTIREQGALERMFYGCTKLKLSTIGLLSGMYRIPSSGSADGMSLNYDCKDFLGGTSSSVTRPSGETIYRTTNSIVSSLKL